MAKRKATSRMPRARKAPKQRRKATMAKVRDLLVGYGPTTKMARYVTEGNQQNLVISNPSSSNSQGFTFALNQVSQFTDFTNMFDVYRIDKVECIFHLVPNPDAYAAVAGATVNSINWYPRLYTDVDYTDITPPTLTEMKARSLAKMVVLKPNTLHKITVRPMPKILVQGPSSFTASTNSHGWISTTDSDVVHFGLKCVLDSWGVIVPAGQSFFVRLDFKYYCSFRKGQ